MRRGRVDKSGDSCPLPLVPRHPAIEVGPNKEAQDECGNADKSTHQLVRHGASIFYLDTGCEQMKIAVVGAPTMRPNVRAR